MIISEISLESVVDVLAIIYERSIIPGFSLSKIMIFTQNWGSRGESWAKNQKPVGIQLTFPAGLLFTFISIKFYFLLFTFYSIGYNILEVI